MPRVASVDPARRAGPRRQRHRARVILVLGITPLFSSPWLLGRRLRARAAPSCTCGPWWRASALARSLRRGYDVGQTINVGYLELRGAHGDRPDGSGDAAARSGDDGARVRGRPSSTVFAPLDLRSCCRAQLVTDADVAFLEGHGEVPGAATTPASTHRASRAGGRLPAAPGGRSWPPRPGSSPARRDFLLSRLVTAARGACSIAAFAQSWRASMATDAARLLPRTCQIPQLADG